MRFLSTAEAEERSHTHQGIFKCIQFLVLGDEMTKLN